MNTEYDESLELYFLAEASDLLQTIEQNLFSLLEEKTIDRVHTLMRSAHTIKGSAANCGFKTVESIAHHLEDVFQALYPEDLVIDRELGSLLLEGYECLREPLTALISQITYDEAVIIDRTATVFARLQDKLGDFFGREAPLPSSEDLGFDVVGLIFKDSVPQDLEQLEKALQSGDIEIIKQTLVDKANFFSELASSYDLPGLNVIAETTLVALEQNPDRIVEIAIASIANLQEAYQAVMVGDRQQGGQLSPELAAWAGINLAESDSGLSDSLVDWDLDSAPAIASNYNEAGEDDLLALVGEEAPETIDVFSRRDDSESIIFFANEVATETEEEIELVDWEAAEDDTPKTGILDTNFSVDLLNEIDEAIAIDRQQEKERESSNQLRLFDKETAITAKSPIERILTSIQIDRGDRKNIQPTPPPAERSKPVADSPTIRVAIDRIDRLSHIVAELSIGESQQNLQTEKVQSLAKQAFEEFISCQQQLEKIRDWSDRNLLLPESRNPKRQKPVGNRMFKATESQFDSLEMDVYSDLHILLQNLSERMLAMGEKIESIDNTMQKLYLDRGKRKQFLSNAREDLLQARMVALDKIFQRFPRMVQQMISTHHKPARLQIIGAEVLVDKAIAEKLYDPLLHLIRNAYDHGLEDVEIRASNNKEITGTITLKAFHQGNRTTIEVKDDGAGLNWSRIRTKALEKGILLPSQAENLPENELAEVLFEHGFSTADRVSDLSGRGVGLDVVRAQLQAIQGTVSIRSTTGEGTTFVLQIPLALTTARLLVCQCQGITYALLSEAIDRVLLPKAEQIQQQPSLTGKGVDRFLRWNDGGRERLIAISNLDRLVDYQYPLPPRTGTINLGSIPIPKQDVNSLLMLKGDRERICIEVEQTLLEQELTIKSIGKGFNLPSYVQGYCVLGDGSLALVINPIELINSKERQAPPATNFVPQMSLTASPIMTEAELINDLAIEGDRNKSLALSGSSDATILVVEDSVVQRQSIVRSLTKAGYPTIQAGNGQEALAQLKQHPNIRAIVCDIEMPYMNGFEFLSYRRQDHHLSQIPTIMLTSRSGQKHRQFALALGANAYLTKPYADRELLQLVSELVVQ
jgi:two-component system, chemotaxis family, sensor histidine kinase and response regulator PixL